MEQSGRESLMEYAEFLVVRHGKRTGEVVIERRDIARPEEETVIASIRRLKKTYPMLDTGKLLHETVSFMMQHMIHGRPARDIIDDIEVYFKTEYEAFIKNNHPNDSNT